MARWAQTWDKKALCKGLGLFGLMILAMMPTGGVGFIIVWFMAIGALISDNHERLLMTMVLIVGVLVGNHLFLPKGMAFHIEQKSLMLFLSLALVMKSVTMGRSSPLVRPFLLLIPYLLWMAISSAQGWNPLVSYLKMFLFGSCFFAFYSTANVVILSKRTSSARLRSIFLSLCCFSLFGSVLLLPFPNLAQLRLEYYLEAIEAGHEVTSLFTGMMYHSQALGPLCALLFICLFSDYIMTERKRDWLYLALMACAPVLIYKTSSRTAMGTLVAGTMFAVWLFLGTRQVSAGRKSKILMACVGLALIGSVGVAFSTAGREAFARFVTKNQTTASMAGVSTEELLTTRQGLMDYAIYNFHKKPMIGNGFQVSENMAAYGGGGVASLLTAPVEKGVWVTAILEEGGVPGMILFVMFGLVAIPTLIKRKVYTGATVLFSMYVVNLGEFTFFSMSGVGGYSWALCFVAVVLDAQRLRERQSMAWHAAMPKFNQIAADEAMAGALDVRGPNWGRG